MLLKKVIVLTLICLIMLTGCSLMPSPDKTIVPPKEKPNISSDNKNLNSIVSGFLSDTASLDPLAGFTEAIRLEDLDGDMIDEIIFTYKDTQNNIGSGVKLLKKDGPKWSDFFKQEYLDGPLKSLEFHEITGDNISEIFITNNRGMDLFVYHSGGWAHHLSSMNSPTSYEIRDIAGPEGGDGMPELIVRSESFSDFSIQVSRWIGYGFTDVGEEYPEIYEEEVTFYQNEVKDRPDSSDMWLKLVESQKRTGKYEDALKSIEKLLGLYNSFNVTRQLLPLKGEVLFKMKKYEEALSVYDYLKKESEKNHDNFISYNDLITPILLAQQQYDKVREYYKSNSNFPYDTNLQELDALIAREKITEYIKTQGLENLDRTADSLGSWGEKNDIVINCIKTQYRGGNLPKVLVLDYHISPEKAFGKDTVGAHVFYWVDGGELHQRVFSVGARVVADHHFVRGLKAGSVEAYMDGSYFKIKVNYENTASVELVPDRFDQVFMIQNNKLKFAWK